ncbi:hypothetical protein [Neorhizobium sp. NCHU2750]|uniref:hypothetical protein n=1 Tax=Neorhizobium sp. NCHU2750 TaxID=1825976 RepID=UPI0013C52874
MLIVDILSHSPTIKKWSIVIIFNDDINLDDFLIAAKITEFGSLPCVRRPTRMKGIYHGYFNRFPTVQRHLGRRCPVCSELAPRKISTSIVLRLGMRSSLQKPFDSFFPPICRAFHHESMHLARSYEPANGLCPFMSLTQHTWCICATSAAKIMSVIIHKYAISPVTSDISTYLQIVI